MNPESPAAAVVPPGWPRWLSAYAGLIALFHVWFNTLGSLPSLWFNSFHLGLLGSLVCWAAAVEAGKRHRLTPAVYLFLGILILLGGIYLPLAEEALRERGETMILPDRIAAATTVILALILCRRTSGWIIPVLVLLAVAYITFFGRYIDGVFHFRGLTLERVLYRFYFTGEGLFGTVGTISATFVFMFILFSAFLLKSGAGDFIIRLARLLTRRLPGGAGYVAIVSSGLTGMITGSAVANTVSTGSITIPMMKRAGFRPAFAAGIETAASTGGQLMPPVMGAGAFLMAQYTGLPYTQIIAAAFLPALLYFLSLAFFVCFEARKTGLTASDNGEPPDRLGPLCREGLHFFAPITVLIGLLVSGFSPTYAAGGGIAAVIAASWCTRKHRMGPAAVGGALALGTRNAAPIAMLLLCTGLVIGALNMTGTGVAFSQLVISWSGGYLIAALGWIAVASLILGMGLPVTAAYVMLAVVAVPALQELGVALLAAHLIIFWLSQDSNVTPPVCLAAFAAAGIAETRPMKAGFQAWKMAKALYIIPLLFAFTPLIDGDWGQRLWVAVFAALGLLTVSAAFAGHGLRPLKRWQCAVLLLIAPALFWPAPLLNLAALLAVPATLALFTRSHPIPKPQPGGAGTQS